MVPVTAERDDQRRRVVVTITDPWSVEEVAVTMDRQVSDQTWPWSVLYDLQRSSWLPNEADLLWLVKRGQQQVVRHGPRGPVAVVMGTRPGADATLQKYADYSELRMEVTIALFQDAVAAHHWLDEHSA